LGLCYLRGLGVTDDLVEAYKWLLLATRQGDEDARKLMTWLEKNLRPEQIA
jgi:TPR repeat protein